MFCRRSHSFVRAEWHNSRKCVLQPDSSEVLVLNLENDSKIGNLFKYLCYSVYPGGVSDD